MDLTDDRPQNRQIVSAPAGRGRRDRPPIDLTPDYLRRLLERGRLTHRDEAVLRVLAEIGALTVEQLARLYWGCLSTARHRLRTLYDLHLLDRNAYDPPRLAKLGLEPGVVYSLGRAGRMWLNWRGGGQERYRLQPHATLYHQLALGEVIVRLVTASQATPGISLAWRGEKPSRVIDRRKTPPVTILEPDGYFTLRPAAGTPRPYFLEIDLDSEGRAAFMAKIRRYQGYANQGDWKQQLGVERFPAVLVITLTPARSQKLLNWLREARPPTNWGVIDLPRLQATPPDQLLRTPLWSVVKDDQDFGQHPLWPK